MRHLRIRKIAAVSVLLLCGAFSTYAQTLSSDRTSYFMDGYLYRHRTNPAQYSYKEYMSLLTGDLRAGVNTNFGLRTFLYPKDGQVYTFLNKNVTEQEFLSKIRSNNLLSASFSNDVFTLGVMHDSRAFSSLSIGARGSITGNIPKELFRFLKSGTGGGDTFSFANLGLRARVYSEIAYGLSYPIGDKIRIGAKAKFLVGIMSMDVGMEKFDVKMNGQELSINAIAALNATLGPISFGMKQDEGSGKQVVDFSAIKMTPGAIRPFGYGFGFDLGATVDLFPWLKVSAAVLDIGRMNWHGRSRYAMNGQYSFTGVEVDFNSESPLGEVLEQEWEKIKGMLAFEADADNLSTRDWLPATANVGAQLFLPGWKALSAGVLLTRHFEKQYSWNEIRGSINLAPVSFFGLGVSYAYSSFGSSIGAALHLQLPLVAIFFAAELPGLRFTPKYAFNDGGAMINWPLDNININMNFGLTMTFGPRYDKRFPKEAKQDINDEYL